MSVLLGKRHRLASPFVRQHLRHTAVLWIVLRVGLTSAMLWSMQGARDLELDSLYGAGMGIFAVTLTVLVSALDRQRVGAPALMANLGVSTTESIVLSVPPPVIGELALNLLIALL